MYRTGLLLIILVFGSLLTAEIARAAAVKPPEPPKISDDDPLRKMIWNEALNAGTNVRYWSALSDSASNTELVYRWLSIGFGLFCFAFPFISRHYFAGDKAVNAAKYLAAGGELIGVIVFGCSLMSMLNQRENYNDLATLEKRWATIKPEYDNLFNTLPVLTQQEAQVRFDALQKAKQAIVPMEPAGTNEVVMHKAWVKEMFARGVDPEYIAKVEAGRKKLNLQPN
jgi:hypothetical protein